MALAMGVEFVAGSTTKLQACIRTSDTQAKAKFLRTDAVYHKNPGDLKIKLTPCEYVLTGNLIYRFTGKIAQYSAMENRVRNASLVLITLIAVMLAGCLPQAQAAPTSTATLAPTTTSRPAPTVTLAVAEETPILLNSGCTVVTQKPTPGPTAESNFPPVSPSDWVRGPADAKVTIIEYSDFQ